MNLKDAAATAGEHTAVIWNLDTSSNLNTNILRFGTGHGVEEHEIEVIVLGVSGSGTRTVLSEKNILYRPGFWCPYLRGFDARP